MSDTEDLARRVDAAATAVAGVVRLYSAAPPIAGLARAVVGASAEAFAAVGSGASPSVTVSVGVAGEAASGAVAADVASAVREIVGRDAEVKVRVSRVHLRTDA